MHRTVDTVELGREGLARNSTSSGPKQNGWLTKESQNRQKGCDAEGYREVPAYRSGEQV